LISGVNQADGHTPLMYAVICAVGALISMVGDLAASAIKRNKEIKDYGKLIPGHGGVLDRFDSVIFTAPIIFYLTGNLLQLAYEENCNFRFNRFHRNTNP
jgi:phosphatidate cytidylyltransferase